MWNAADSFKKAMDVILMFVFNKIINQLPMANSVHWYGNVLRRKDVHVMRGH